VSEPDQRPLIGARLRATRLARRQTVAEMASASGMTKGFLSRLGTTRVLWVISPALPDGARAG